MAGNAVVLADRPDAVLCSRKAELVIGRVCRERCMRSCPVRSVVGTAITDNCDYLMFTGSSAPASPVASTPAVIYRFRPNGGKNP